MRAAGDTRLQWGCVLSYNFSAAKASQGVKGLDLASLRRAWSVSSSYGGHQLLHVKAMGALSSIPDRVLLSNSCCEGSTVSFKVFHGIETPTMASAPHKSLFQSNFR